MIKRIVVTGLKARGYVDGRYVGEDKKEGARERTDVLGTPKRRGKAGAGTGVGKGRGKKRGVGAGGLPADNLGNATAGKRGKRGKTPGRGHALGGQAAGAGAGNTFGQPPAGRGARGQPRSQPRKNKSGRKTPFRPGANSVPLAPSPSEMADSRRFGDETKSGQFAEALAAQANVKRERLHKVMAQSGIGSRRDMEIMIAGGRVMVNGIVATAGTQVSPGDNVMVDHRPIKLKFNEELPRVLLYHKPEGEIVTTNDPGNRITVFDNLPRVENGKWVAIGRLDINTSGLLIFTTSGELANRFMHPRYEVEREYAVRILGELTEEQTQALLAGVNIDFERDEDDEDDEDHPIVPARFDTIEKRGGEGVNQWYHVTIKEGRNREVRKMFESQGLTVSRLIRIRFGQIELPQRLARGKMMELAPDQVRSILTAAGIADEFGAAAAGPRAPLPARQRSDRGPGQGQGQGPGPGAGKPRRGPPRRPAEAGAAMPGPGNENGPPAIDGQAPADDAARARRSRRGGKGRRPPNGPNGPQQVSAGDNAGNRVPRDAGNAAEAGNSGEFVAVSNEANGNMGDGIAAPKPPKPPGNRGGRNRPRRNFRGRNGRNRGGREGGGPEGSGGPEGGNSSGGSGSGNGGDGGGNSSGNSGGDGGGNGNSGGGEGNF